MKKIYTFILITLLFTAHSIEAKEITFLGNYQKAPKIFLDKNNKPKGILIDIAREIEKLSNDKYSFNLSPWQRVYKQALHTKKHNEGIIGITKNKKRLRLFDYSASIYNDTNYLVVLKSKNLKITKIEELQGLKVSYNKKGYFGTEFEKAKKFFISNSDANNTIRLRRLLNGRIDAALIGGPKQLGLKMALELHKELKQNAHKFEILPLEFSNPDYIAFSKTSNNKPYLKELNIIINKLHKEGTIQKIIDKYNNK